MKFGGKMQKTKFFHDIGSSREHSQAKKNFAIFCENFGQNTPFLGTPKIFWEMALLGSYSASKTALIQIGTKSSSKKAATIPLHWRLILDIR